VGTETHVTRKRFGQHFLHDPAIVSRIVDVFAPQSDQRIIEIGPGLGVLTRELVMRLGSGLDVIEIDRDLADRLETDQQLREHITVHRADALRFDFETLKPDPGRTLRIVGNLPYMITTPLLFRFIEIEHRVSDMLFMLQKEVVERIVAEPGSRKYGRLGIMLSPWFDCQHVFDVGPGAFKPPPKVNSAIVHFRPRAGGPLDLGDRQLYAEVVRQAFSARRKTLKNALAGLVDGAVLAALDIDPGLRPESLYDRDFARIAKALAADRDAQ